MNFVNPLSLYLPSAPGIKSDRWIKRQCTLPTFMVVERYMQTLDSTKTSCYPVHVTEEEIKFSMEKAMAVGSGDIGIISYRTLTDEEKAEWVSMISPFEPNQVRVSESGNKLISYGTSSFGYDVRCSNQFKVFTNIHSTVVDPKNFDTKSLVDMETDVCIIPPNSFALARTVERFNIPRNVLAICLGKSTYARCGIIVNVTPLEPEWDGYLTLEFSNTTPLPAKIYANEGCAQLLFFESDEDCETSYKDRKGKYMDQIGEPVPPRV